jgi:peptidoglycan/LPS O-acetylase OafA/YrhL
MGAAPAFSGAIQVLYTWLMIFGMLGLFGHLITRENKTLRYLSDASYWLYLSHIPLVIALQGVVRSWPLLPSLKFLIVFTLATGALLAIYQTLVRDTVLGTLLNGRRQKNAT